MEKILFLAQVETDGTLAKPAMEALGAARQLAQQLGTAFSAGFVGGTVDAAANEIGACGADKFLGVAGTDFAPSRYSTDAAAAEAIARASGATVVVAAATSRWMRSLPGVAQRLSGRVDTHVTGFTVEGQTIKVNRWFYRQRMEGSLSRAARPWFILIDPGSMPAAAACPGTAAVEPVAVTLTDAHRNTAVLSIREPAADAQTIRPDAKVLFVTGAGWTKKQADGQAHPQEAEALIMAFLRKTRSSLGSTKSLVDLGGEGQAVLPFLSHLNQVGQTGSTPRHPKGLATCCHGEEPHTVGWRFINERRAVNRDGNCGWARGKADVVYVADAFEVMTKLNALLGAK
jgi:electron transfer flavoprotein alpha subunit